MIIELEYLGAIVLTLETSNNTPDETIDISADAPDLDPEEEQLLLENLKRQINNSYGHYGHLVDWERTTNLDLYASILTLKDYKVLSVEGLPKPPKLPEDAQS